MSLRRARSAGPASALFRHLHGGEGGFSIAEELVSLIVLASAVGLVLAGIYLGSQGIRLRRGQVLAAVLAQSQLELVADTTYSANPTAVPYPTVEPVTGLAVAVEVDYWTAPDGPFTSTVRNDGLQRLTVSVADGAGEILSLEELKVNR